MQLGFGWGKGRRVIKTIIRDDALIRALDRHQDWVDAHRDDDTRALDDYRQTRTDALEALRRTNVSLRGRLRMAKAAG